MPNLGIDIGNVLRTIEIDILPNAFEVIERLQYKFNNIYIISRVNDSQRERALRWFETSDIFNRTGIIKENVYFCFDRRDKAVFVRGLNIDYFIDDRADVLRHLPNKVIKILFNPTKDLDMIGNLNNCIILNTWEEIGKWFNV